MVVPLREAAHLWAFLYRLRLWIISRSEKRPNGRSDAYFWICLGKEKHIMSFWSNHGDLQERKINSDCFLGKPTQFKQYESTRNKSKA
jgi:hypothetical protein